MRKELRIGLGVGCVLVVGLVAWMLFPASSQKDSARRLPSGAGTGPEAQPSRTDSTPPAVAESGGTSGPTTPERHTTVDIGPAEGTGGGAASSGSAGGTTSVAEAPEPVPPAAGGAWDWARALDHGAPVPLLARTETPSPTPSHGGAPLAAVARSTVAESTTSSGTASGGGARRYTVKAGETYWTIAQAEYGNGAMYTLLVKANPDMPPNRLRPGAVITIPGKGDSPGSAAAPAPAMSSTGGAAPSAEIDPNTQYRVQAGDSLYSICRKLYGKVEREKLDRLYELNKEAIGPNRAVLRQNMILKLPEAPTAGRVAGAAQ